MSLGCVLKISFSLVRNPERLLVAILIGNTFANIFAGTVISSLSKDSLLTASILTPKSFNVTFETILKNITAGYKISMIIF
ncbi:DUF21 domain-containing protein, partial [Francisella tularensis]|nr:DUF21 domain-containing protein [Francisella tularensis]